MHKNNVLDKGKYTYAQNVGAVAVDSYVVLSEGGKKYLLLRMRNDRDEAFDSLTLRVTQYNAEGAPIASDKYEFKNDGWGADSFFVLDDKLPLRNDCVEFRANVACVTYGNYRYTGTKEGVSVDYVPVRGASAFNADEKLKSMKGKRLSVRTSVFRKSLIAIVFAAALTVGIFLLGVFNLDNFKNTATSFLKDGVEYSFIDGDKGRHGTLAVVGYSGSGGDVYIPAEIDGYPVVKVASPAFEDERKISSVNFGGLIEIEDRAFAYCEGLSSVNFENVMYIGNEAFLGCTNLAEVNSGEVAYIGYNAFGGCQSLGSVNLYGDGEVLYLGEGAFNGCSSLNSVVIGKPTEYQSYSSLFGQCHALETLSLANFNTAADYVGDGTITGLFGWGESNLKFLDIGELGSISDGFCNGLYLLESINIGSLGDGIVGRNAFFGCSSLREISFSGGITDIEDYAFAQCGNLQGVQLPEGVKYIGNYAFDGCVNLSQIDIPESVNFIGDYAFASCGLLGIELPSGLETVGNYAFYRCDEIESLVFPDSVQSIGAGCLQYCDSLKVLSVPFTGTTRLSGQSFATIFGDSPYSSMYVPQSLKEVYVTDASFLADDAFYTCDYIERVYLSDGLEKIGNNAFSNCTALIEVDMPDSVSSIGDYAFAYCSSLPALSMPNSLEYVGMFAFRYCSGITEFEFPVGVQTLGLGCLEQCSSLESLTTPFVGESRSSNCFLPYMFGNSYYWGDMLPDTLSEVIVTDSYVIADRAFYGCIALKSVSLPETTTSIGEYAFAECTSLTSVNMPRSLSSIGQYAFSRSALTEVEFPDGLASIGQGAFSDCVYLGSVRLPSSLNATGIGSYAFSNCYRLYKVFNDGALPIVIGADTYGGVSKYAYKIYSNGEEEVSAQKDGYEFTLFGEDWYLTYAPMGMVSADLPSYFDYDGELVLNYRIPARLFHLSYSLEDVYIPDSVTDVGESAFEGCYSLVRAEFSQISPVTVLSQNLFSGCEKLSELTLPDGVQAIKEGAFYGCSGLTEFTVGAEVYEIGNMAFSYCYRLLEIYNYSVLDIVAGQSDFGEIAAYAVAVYTPDEKPDSQLVTIDGVIFAKMEGSWYAVGCSDDVTELRLEAFSHNGEYVDSFVIRREAFRNRQSLSSVYIGEAVTAVEQRAFSNCLGLTSVVFDNTRISSLGEYAFSGCNSLSTVVLPENLEEIGAYAFISCAISSIELPESLKKIGDYAFGDTRLEEVTLPQNLMSVGVFAFESCQNLYSVTIMSGQTAIGEYAFNYCSSLMLVNNYGKLDLEYGSDTYGKIAENAAIINTDPSAESGIIQVDGFIFVGADENWYLGKYTGYYSDIVIPESFTFNGKTISSFKIASKAFIYTYCQSLTIPVSVTEIRPDAFYQVSNINYVSYGGTADEWKELCVPGCGLEGISVYYDGGGI